MAFLSGQNNGGFVAQGAQNIQQPFTSGQVLGAQGQVLGGLDQQQQLVNALSAQNGIQNQGNVYGQLQNVAQGQGFNPAQAMLNQATGQNVANQAALAASQRGGSANVGLLARQAGQQGMGAQQQAVGQGATLQAQQSLGALGQAGGIAGQQVGNQMGALQGLNAGYLGNQGQLIGGIGAQNAANIQDVTQQNQANAAIAASNNQVQQGMVGGLMQGVGAGLVKGAALAHGGMVLPSHIQSIASIYHGSQPMMMQGGMVPGVSPQAGDHLSNDTVNAKLSPGEVVIPKSIMESEDPVSGAAQFVAALQKKKGGVEGDFKSALAQAIQNRKP